MSQNLEKNRDKHIHSLQKIQNINMIAIWADLFITKVDSSIILSLMVIVLSVECLRREIVFSKENGVKTRGIIVKLYAVVVFLKILNIILLVSML